MVGETKQMDADWKSLSPDERLARRLEAWASPPGVEFVSPEAEAEYKARVTRFKHAIQLKTPDRVPIVSGLGAFATAYYGYTQYDMMYDADKVVEVAIRATQEFQLDVQIGAGGISGRVMEILEDKQWQWPGHGVSLDNTLQYSDIEYMKADEYDAFIYDPSDYRMRTYLPRTMAALEPLSKLPPFRDIGGMSRASLASFGLPEVERALQKLVEAGRATIEWQKKVGPTSRRLVEMGFPSLTSGSTWGPFPTISDSMRGTHGVMMDILRQPAKLLEAMEQVTPPILKGILASARPGSSPIVAVHMHKCGDGIMSDKQFKTFYWGPLRKLCMGFIEEGLIPRFSLEGPFNSRSRLEIFRDLPKGKAIWWSEGGQTDMAQLKEVLGDVACIEGDVPASRLVGGTPEETAAFCRRMIDVCGKNGGYIFSTSPVDRNARIENIRAMIRTAKEYGVSA